jgi:hypothetical protein
MRIHPILQIATLVALSTIARAERPSDLFMVRTTAKAPDVVVAEIRSYSESMQWQYLGENKVKKGEVRLVKICIPEVGRLIWPVGLKLSALLPCGNVGIYQNGPMTEVSVLHPRYMHMLYPHPATARASAVAEPLLAHMLDAVTKSRSPPALGIGHARTDPALGRRRPRCVIGGPSGSQPQRKLPTTSASDVPEPSTSTPLSSPTSLASCMAMAEPSKWPSGDYSAKALQGWRMPLERVTAADRDRALKVLVPGANSYRCCRPSTAAHYRQLRALRTFYAGAAIQRDHCASKLSATGASATVNKALRIIPTLANAPARSDS